VAVEAEHINLIEPPAVMVELEAEVMAQVQMKLEKMALQTLEAAVAVEVTINHLVLETMPVALVVLVLLQLDIEQVLIIQKQQAEQ
tara:strand:- start:38 stop:295 length:258 start_codon:yes stop_codon:yes gene_type:complete